MCCVCSGSRFKKKLFELLLFAKFDGSVNGWVRARGRKQEQSLVGRGEVKGRRWGKYLCSDTSEKNTSKECENFFSNIWVDLRNVGVFMTRLLLSNSSTNVNAARVTKDRLEKIVENMRNTLPFYSMIAITSSCELAAVQRCISSCTAASGSNRRCKLLNNSNNRNHNAFCLCCAVNDLKCFQVHELKPNQPLVLVLLYAWRSLFFFF